MSTKKSCIAIDNDKLISFVERNRPLYDKKEKDYRDLDVVNNIWGSISKALGVSVSDARIRWRSLKDTYVRKRRELKESKKSGSARGDVKEPKWPYFKSFGFLDKCMPDDNTESNMVGSGDEDSQHEEDVVVPTFNQDQESSFIDSRQASPTPSQQESPTPSCSSKRTSTTGPSQEQVSPSLPLKKRGRKAETSVSNVLTVLEETRERNKKRQEQRDTVLASLQKEPDCDEMFLLSFVNDLKSLPESTKSLVNQNSSIVSREQIPTTKFQLHGSRQSICFGQHVEPVICPIIFIFISDKIRTVTFSTLVYYIDSFS